MIFEVLTRKGNRFTYEKVSASHFGEATLLMLDKYFHDPETKIVKIEDLTLDNE